MLVINDSGKKKKQKSPESSTALDQSWRDTDLRIAIIAALAREAILDLLHLAKIGIGIGIELGLPDDKAHRCLRHLFCASGPRGIYTVGSLFTGSRCIGRRLLRRALDVTFKNTFVCTCPIRVRTIVSRRMIRCDLNHPAISLRRSPSAKSTSKKLTTHQEDRAETYSSSAGRRHEEITPLARGQKRRKRKEEKRERAHTVIVFEGEMYRCIDTVRASSIYEYELGKYRTECPEDGVAYPVTFSTLASSSPTSSGSVFSEIEANRHRVEEPRGTEDDSRWIARAALTRREIQAEQVAPSRGAGQHTCLAWAGLKLARVQGSSAVMSPVMRQSRRSSAGSFLRVRSSRSFRARFNTRTCVYLQPFGRQDSLSFPFLSLFYSISR